MRKVVNGHFASAFFSPNRITLCNTTIELNHYYFCITISSLSPLYLCRLSLLKSLNISSIILCHVHFQATELSSNPMSQLLKAANWISPIHGCEFSCDIVQFVQLVQLQSLCNHLSIKRPSHWHELSNWAHVLTLH